MNTPLLDASSLTALAFIVFLVLVWKKCSVLIGGAMDDRARKVRQELDDAVRLKEEAQALLGTYQKRYDEIMTQANNILEQAERTAEALRKQAETDIEQQLQNYTEQAKQRMDLEEHRLKEKLKNDIVTIATEAARTILQNQRPSSSSTISALPPTSELRRLVG